MHRLEPWHGHCQLQFSNNSGNSRHQGGCSAPFKLLRADLGDDGRCEIPLLHTAGGLVGGDQLSIDLSLEPSSKSLITSVAAQKIYGSIGRSKLHPDGTDGFQIDEQGRFIKKKGCCSISVTIKFCRFW